jgi:hypothetical protein
MVRLVSKDERLIRGSRDYKLSFQARLKVR